MERPQGRLYAQCMCLEIYTLIKITQTPTFNEIGVLHSQKHAKVLSLLYTRNL